VRTKTLESSALLVIGPSERAYVTRLWRKVRAEAACQTDRMGRRLVEKLFPSSLKKKKIHFADPMRDI
jgi:hypothetical protein